ncbi:MAG: hypothetical protein ACK5S6_00370 [bacterium]
MAIAVTVEHVQFAQEQIAHQVNQAHQAKQINQEMPMQIKHAIQKKVNHSKTQWLSILKLNGFTMLG